MTKEEFKQAYIDGDWDLLEQFYDAVDQIKTQLPTNIKFDDNAELGVHQTWGSRSIECYDFCKYVHNILKL